MNIFACKCPGLYVVYIIICPTLSVTYTDIYVNHGWNHPGTYVSGMLECPGTYESQKNLERYMPGNLQRISDPTKGTGTYMPGDL